MFSKYYQSELAFLRGMGKEFAVAHPELAGLLAERGGDPDVERLLEGFAFLAARLRERLDDAMPELIHDLAEVLLPQVLRPVPACTVMEFLPVAGALRGRHAVPAGAEVASIPVDGVSCRFRTTAPLDLLPVSVVDATLDAAIGASPTVRLQLHAPQAVLPAVLSDEGIRFFIQGDAPFASTLLVWLARHLRGVEVRAPAARRSVQLGARAVRVLGLEPGFSLLPWPGLAPAGYRPLLEYFTLPQKFMFFEVRGLAAARELAEERLELVLQFERPPELPARIGKDTFRVNCAPAVNLFATAADPVAVAVLGEEHLLRAAGLDPRHAEVFAVDRVEGLPDARGGARPYAPFTSFGHGARGKDARFYRLRRRGSVVDDGLDAFVSVGTPRDGAPAVGEEVLSIDLTCTNRSLPARLKLGDVSVPTESSPTTARFRNITPVTNPVRPPLAGELQWRLVSHLASTRASLARPEALRSLLGLYNLPALSDEQAGRANQLRIEGIRGVDAAPARRLLEGAPVRGLRISIELDDRSFASPGDAFLFGAVLDALFAAQAPINSFTEVVARLTPSGREYAWTPRNGTRTIA
jgi:type VI secretion system protein ImpG